MLCKDYDDGQYYPDPNGDGKYYPDNSGQYIPDNSGQYFVGNADNYGEIKDYGYPYKESDAYFGEYDDKSLSLSQNKKNEDQQHKDDYVRGTLADYLENFQESGNDINDGNFLGSSSFLSTNSAPNLVKSATIKHYTRGRHYSDSGSSYVHPSPHGYWKIVEQSDNINDDGYRWRYKTENGITAEESGKLENKGSKNEFMKTKGSYHYTGPDNVEYHVQYTADEHGFVAVGDHLPTPHPIPEYIRKSLKLQNSVKFRH